MQWLAFALDCHATSDLCLPLAIFVQLLPAMSMCRVSRACLAVTVCVWRWLRGRAFAVRLQRSHHRAVGGAGLGVPCCTHGRSEAWAQAAGRFIIILRPVEWGVRVSGGGVRVLRCVRTLECTAESRLQSRVTYE